MESLEQELRFFLEQNKENFLISETKLILKIIHTLQAKYTRIAELENELKQTQHGLQVMNDSYAELEDKYNHHVIGTS